MVILDVDFSEGDYLTAGVVTSTSSVNGITTTINSNTLTKLMLSGSDTEGSVASSSDETTIATYTIPAGTFKTGCLAMANVHFYGGNSAPSTSTFRLKIGPSGTEVEKQEIILANSSTSERIGASLLFFDSAETYTNELVVIVTAQNSGTGALDTGTCYQLVVMGY